MKIWLTGAKGFTGRHFECIAQSAGHQVASLDADLTNPEALKTQAQMLLDQDGSPDAVVHLAALSFVGLDNPSAFFQVNAIGSLNLLQVLRDCRDRVVGFHPTVLMASSANIYGNCSASPVSEQQMAAPLNHYAASKVAMEAIAHVFMPELPIVVVRPFNYTGPGQSQDFLVPKLVSHFRARSPSIALGNLYVQREFNDVRWVCRVYLDLLLSGQASQTYNICTGRTYAISDVLEQLQQLTGHRPNVVQDPSLVRPNEPIRLSGDPTKLRDVLRASGGGLSQTSWDEASLRGPELTTVLADMLAA